MIELPILFTSLLVVMISLGIIFVFIVLKQKKQEKYEESNYYAFFVMGIVWAPVGIIYMIATMTISEEIPFILGIPLFSMGLIYLIIGSNHRDKWLQ